MNITLEQLQTRAAALSLRIEEDHVGDSLGFWLVDPHTGDGPMQDENFSTSLEEVEGKLSTLEAHLDTKHLS